MVKKLYEVDFKNDSYKAFDSDENIAKSGQIKNQNFGQGLVEHIEINSGFYVIEFDNGRYTESRDLGEFSRLIIRFSYEAQLLSIIMYGEEIITLNNDFHDGSTAILFKDNEVVMKIERIFVGDHIYRFSVERVANFGACSKIYCEDC